MIKRKNLFFIFLLFLVLPIVSAGEYFDITESFKYNVYGNSSNFWGGGTNPQWINESIGNSYVWRMDNDWYVFFKQGDRQPIRNITQDGLNTLSSYSYLNSDFRIAYVMNISRCNYDNCYLTPQTRLEFNLNYQAYTITGSTIYPNIAFKSKYLNHSNTRLDFNNTNGYFIAETYNLDAGDFEGYNFDYGNTSISSPISMTYRPTYVYCNISQFINGGFVNITLEDLPSDNPYCNVNYNDEIDGFWITFRDDDDGVSQEQYIADLKIYNLFNGTNQLPYFNVSPNQTYYCVNFSATLPVRLRLNWSVVDLENDTIQYAVSTPSTYENFYKDYMRKRILSYRSWLPDYDFLDDNLIQHQNNNDYCKFDYDFFVLNESSNRLIPFIKEANGYSLLPYNYQGYALELDNDCKGYKIYNVKTDHSFKEFHYNTTLMGLGNGENFTLQFLDQNFNLVVDLMFKGNNGNLSISSSDGNNYQELYNLETDYNLTSIGIVYINNGSIIIDGKTKDSTISNFSTAYVSKTLTDLDFIEYVRINFTNVDYMIQTMYAYEGESNVLNWTTIQPVYAYLQDIGLNTFNYYVKDNLHSSFRRQSFTVKLDEKQYCFYSQQDYQVIDTLIGTPLKNLIDFFGYQKEYRNTVYFMFFVLTILLLFGLYSGNQAFNLTLATTISSLVCFIFSFLVKDTPTMITFIVIFSLSIVSEVISRR